jgi:hypothetical protein
MVSKRRITASSTARFTWTARPKYFFLCLFFTVLIGCQTDPGTDLNNSSATEGFSPKDTDKLFVVDCLLPGQVRKLGTQMTYISSRRPIRTTAGECEIRGGEYVAYDRANFASALKVWLPQAQQGDAEAQVTLGEIYEKGLGGMADPALAAQWYLKAAEQGNSRAQVNLGYLYEKGLGVKKDIPTALNWYRKASGLANSDLQFASVTEAAVANTYKEQLEELRQESQSHAEEAKSLRRELDETRQQLSSQQRKLSDLRRQLDNTRDKLEQERGKSNRNDAMIHSLEKELEEKLSSLNAQQTRVSQLETQFHKEQQQAKAGGDASGATNESGGQQQTAQSRQKLEQLQEQLKSLEAEYHNTSIRIKSDMSALEGKASGTGSTQEKLALEKLRGKLKQDKSELLAQGLQIKELKKTIEQERQALASLEATSSQALAQNGPVIDIIDPPMTLTRGVPSYQLRSIDRSKKIVGKVGAADSLKTLQINEQNTTVDADGMFRTDIAIESALTPVKIVAVDKQGKRSIVTFNLLAKNQETVADEKTLPVKASSKSYPSVDFGRFYALIIGNNDYKQLPTLKTSINDAKAVDEMLRTRYGYKTTLLVNASRHQIMTAFNDLRKVLTEKDNLLIYYAGHGEIDKNDQSAYWLPSDAEPDNNANWLSSHNITQYLSILPAKHILVIADSCYSGAMTETSIVRLPDEMPEEKREKWLKFMNNRKARTVMTSGGVKPVLDSGSGGHSVFANAFLKALGSNTGLLEDYELYRILSGKVKQSASQIGFQQSPQYSAMQHAGHEGSPFFFVPRS